MSKLIFKNNLILLFVVSLSGSNGILMAPANQPVASIEQALEVGLCSICLEDSIELVKVCHTSHLHKLCKACNESLRNTPGASCPTCRGNLLPLPGQVSTAPVQRPVTPVRQSPNPIMTAFRKAMAWVARNLRHDQPVAAPSPQPVRVIEVRPRSPERQPSAAPQPRVFASDRLFRPALPVRRVDLVPVANLIVLSDNHFNNDWPPADLYPMSRQYPSFRGQEWPPAIVVRPNSGLQTWNDTGWPPAAVPASVR